MKQSFFYFLNLALILSLIFSSCTKEEEIVLGCTYSTATNYNPSATTDDGSCNYSVNGCIDFLAMNFNPQANLNDGSCIYAYDLAIGIWNISPDCDEYTVPVIWTTISLNDQLPETIDVQGGGGDLLYILIGETQINGIIDNLGNITVTSQTVSFHMGFGPMDIDIEGNGLIVSSNSGNMDLIYSFDIEVVPGFPISESLNCSISLSR